MISALTSRAIVAFAHSVCRVVQSIRAVSLKAIRCRRVSAKSAAVDWLAGSRP
jgi:hypothetical protein